MMEVPTVLGSLSARGGPPLVVRICICKVAESCGDPPPAGCLVMRRTHIVGSKVQGYLTYQKTHPPRTLH